MRLVSLRKIGHSHRVTQTKRGLRKMMSLRVVSPHFFSTTKSSLIRLTSSSSSSYSTPTRIFFCTNKSPFSTHSKMTTATTTPIVEHVVLFKVKDETDPSKINSMLNGLNSLVSLDQVLYLSAGPIFRNRSPAFNFTHILHSRYENKDDLAAYSAHPEHTTVVKQSVLPICEDIMSIDWVFPNLVDASQLIVPSGSAMRVQFMKLKEGLGETEKGEVLGVIGGLEDRFNFIHHISFGENFSPARAKGFSIASLAVFPGLAELDALNDDKVKGEKDRVRDLLDSVIVVDYLLPPPTSANL